MFAVIKTGGKQYTVAANDVITIERLEGEAGDVIAFTEVLMLGGEKAVVGSPFVVGATVVGTLVEQARGPKVISFKKRRRQNSKRKKGHRQHLSLVSITEILTDGKKPEGVKAAKVAKPIVAEAEAAPAAKPVAKKAAPEKAAPEKAAPKAEAEAAKPAAKKAAPKAKKAEAASGEDK